MQERKTKPPAQQAEGATLCRELPKCRSQLRRRGKKCPNSGKALSEAKGSRGVAWG